MAKKKMSHSHQEKVHQKQKEPIQAPQQDSVAMKNEASMKLVSLKSLNQRLLKEAMERRKRDGIAHAQKGKLRIPAAIAATSVHKYWISAFRKATYNAELTELLKLDEMYTSQGHVLNYELYKVLAMKVDELHSIIGGDEDVDALRSENKDLQE
ncbi:Uncharacterized protein Fot_35251 [Forsythia ovata]|uniref:Uncharacterized protein n=1 Tax=Forsythia ovata TaxID=205694 RepID=A0ABD1SM32_9LAMI